MATPQSTPLRHAKLGISSTKSLPLANEYKKLFADQHQRLNLKHQQDLDLIDDIRSYVKARLSIEKDYNSALNKLARQHSNHIGKKFALLRQLEEASHDDSQQEVSRDDQHHRPKRRLLGGGGGQRYLESTTTNQNLSSSNANSPSSNNNNNSSNNNNSNNNNNNSSSNNNNFDIPESPCSLYKVWSEHINRLQLTSRSRSDQFEQLTMIVDKLKDIRSHKAHIGKKCLDTHLKRIHEDLLVSMVDLERSRKLYYEDESQAKKARENEEKIKKKRSGLLTKFTDLQAKKEKSSAQREATDIQSTQARNDYIMSLAAANAHLDYYYHRDLNDFIHLIDDGVLDHCKIFMATLSECDINSLKDSLSHAQYWSKLIAMTGSQQTNAIFLDCENSQCLKGAKRPIEFEACNNDPISRISLEHNADYALQHEIDKWFTWFKKECRNLSHLIHQLETCQNALADGKKSIELNGQTVDDLEPKLVELKQQIRKSEAAKLKAQARLKVIKEGGMPIEEWSAVESEIVADMARAQEEQERARRLRELKQASGGVGDGEEPSDLDRQRRTAENGAGDRAPIQLQVSRDSADNEDSETGQGACTPVVANESMHNLASVSRSTTNYLLQKQQNAISGYSALADPSLVWQDDYSAASGVWPSATAASQATTTAQTLGQTPSGPEAVVVTADLSDERATELVPNVDLGQKRGDYDLLGAKDQNNNRGSGNCWPNGAGQQQAIANSMSIQSSSPLSAIVANSNGQPMAQSPYQLGMMGEAYKSDYECDYSRTAGHQQAHLMRSSAASSGGATTAAAETRLASGAEQQQLGAKQDEEVSQNELNSRMLNKHVVAVYAFERANEDDLALEEDDVLVVTSVNEEDANWVHARNVHTGQEGYVPSSYIRLQEEAASASLQRGDDFGDSFDQQQQQFGYEQQQDETSQTVEAAGGAPPCAADGLAGQRTAGGYCRAVYDYEPPKGDTVDEEDGLPHLKLVQGELMRIVDQGHDDGWWLVEKSDGVLGHVPSMLVEELDDDDDEDDDDEEQQANEYEADEPEGDEELEACGDVTTGDKLHDGPTMLPPPLPSNEAPVLADNEPVSETTECYSYAEQQVDRSAAANSNSLVATSFVIIEPTPEVESKRFISSGDETDEQAEEATSLDQKPAKPQVGSRQSTAPSSDVSYSLVNEDFVLERPTRKPYYSNSTNQDHHEPTIVEEDSSIDVALEARASEQEANSENVQSNELEYQAKMPAISVVIDTVENIPRSPDESFDAEQESHEQESEQEQLDNSSSSDAPPKGGGNDEQLASKVKRSANVDCSPILRHHAEEFSKLIIDEALMLAPGSSIGPSTSSASIDHDERFLDQNYSDDE